MADAPDSGTPLNPAGTDPQGGGTAGASVDGGEHGKPVDQKLALSWKQKAERLNEAERQRDEAIRAAEEARARLAAATSAAAPRVDPSLAAAQELAERAAYDPDARLQLEAMRLSAHAAAQAKLTREMIAYGVPAEHIHAVEDHVTRSGFQMSVPDALAIVVPPSVAEGQARIRSIEEENAKLRKQLEDATRSPAPGWAGSSSSGGSATTPIMPIAEYQARLAAGGPDALKLREQADSGAIRLDRSRR